MGNAPLPNPPEPTERRIVLPIATGRNWCSTRFVVHSSPRSSVMDATDTDVQPTETDVQTDIPTATQSDTGQQNKTESNADCESPIESFTSQDGKEEEKSEGDNEEAPINASLTITAQPGSDADAGPLYSMPLPLRNILSPEEYQQKMNELQDRLYQCKTGTITLALLIISFALVLFWVILLFVPQHGFNWNTSKIGEQPFPLLAIGAGLVGIYGGCYYYIQHEATVLIQDVQDIFRPWRRLRMRRRQESNDDSHGNSNRSNTAGGVVHVVLKRVSHVDILCDTAAETMPNNDRRSDTRLGQLRNKRRHDVHSRRIHSNCFCLVMTIISNDSAMLEQQPSHDNSPIDTTMDIEMGSMPTSRNVHQARVASLAPVVVDEDLVSLGTCNTDGSDETRTA